MEISNRDAGQSGQAILEYILILIVAITIILGGLYQLNDAFKGWATNYFGNYLACLLETGEMPSSGVSSAGGGGGICNQFFKEFNIADGRPLIGAGGSGGPGGGEQEPRGGGGNGQAASENPSYRAGGYSSAGGAFGRLGARSGRSPGSGRKSKLRSKEGTTNTGSTDVSNYGSSRSSTRKQDQKFVRHRLDNRFAFEDQKEEKVKRKAASTAKKREEGSRTKRSLLKRKEIVKADQTIEDEPMTFAGFIRILIIAAIIIALVMFLGGQALQVGKSMESQ